MGHVRFLVVVFLEVLVLFLDLRLELRVFKNRGTEGKDVELLQYVVVLVLELQFLSQRLTKRLNLEILTHDGHQLILLVLLDHRNILQIVLARGSLQIQHLLIELIHRNDEPMFRHRENLLHLIRGFVIGLALACPLEELLVVDLLD